MTEPAAGAEGARPPQQPQPPRSYRPWAVGFAAASALGTAFTARSIRRDMARADAEAAVVRTLDKKEVSAYVHERYRPFAKMALKHASVLSLYFGVAATAAVVYHYDLRSPAEFTQHMRAPTTRLRDAVKAAVVPWSQRMLGALRAPLKGAQESVSAGARGSGLVDWAAGRGNGKRSAESYDAESVAQERAVLEWLEEQGHRPAAEGLRELDSIGREVARLEAADAEAAGGEGGGGGVTRPSRRRKTEKGGAEEMSDRLRAWMIGGVERLVGGGGSGNSSGGKSNKGDKKD